MIVKSIGMSGFMSYGPAGEIITLPDRGVVLVQGHNGSGKSSLIEAVSVGLWGKTLRGTQPWREGEEGVVSIVTDNDLRVTRTRSVKGKTSLGWSHANDTTKFDTATKAQDALEHVIGTHDVWRRTSVFSSQDASHFTLATDGDRKRLLETLLGLDRFDEALDRCRRELRTAERTKASAETAMQVQQARTEGEAKRREDAERALAELGAVPDVAAMDAKLIELRETVDAITKDINACRARKTVAERALLNLDRDMKEVERELKRLESGHCPTCNTPWAPELIAAAQAKHDAMLEAHTVQRVQWQKDLADLTAEEVELSEDRDAASKRQFQIASERVTAVGVAKEHARLSEQLNTVATGAAEAEAKLAELTAQAQEAKRIADELLACERVLSLTGVRSKLLTDALSGVEQIANVWLGRIAGWGLRLELKPYGEKANGGVKDAISLEVHGAGGGFGYKGASAGERRRIDVALLLALAEVANASHGTVASTLFFDEVFDALDADGVEAVCRVIEELAIERPIVLITHSPLLEQSLEPTCVVQRVRVSAGALQHVSRSAEGEGSEGYAVQAWG
jgi:exonuclease SbcC